MKKIFSNKKKRKKRKSKNISTTMKRKFIIEKYKNKATEIYERYRNKSNRFAASSCSKTVVFEK